MFQPEVNNADSLAMSGILIEMLFESLWAYRVWNSAKVRV